MHRAPRATHGPPEATGDKHMSQYAAQDIGQAVIDRMADAPNPRFKEVMTALIQHLHAFAQEVQLTPDEWMAGIQFLTDVGKMCDEKRPEFILLSDTLGPVSYTHLRAHETDSYLVCR